MVKSNRIYIFMILVAMLGLGACGGKEESSGVAAPPDEAPTEPGGSIPAQPPTVSASQPLSIQISTKFDTTNYNEIIKFTETGTNTCTASAATPVVTCTAVVPEGRLYFSSMKLAYSYLPSNCRILTFQPYYYRASTSATYLPPWMQGQQGEGVDCSGAVDLSPDCFGGVAPLVINGFPNKTALISLPDETDLTIPIGVTVDVPSAFSKEYRSNRMTVNDLTVPNQALAHTAAALGGQGDGYIANSFVNYKFSCRDNWADAEAYIINLNIRDEDTDAAGPNDFLTWKELP